MLALLRSMIYYSVVGFIMKSNIDGGAVDFVEYGSPIPLYVPNLSSSLAFMQNTSVIWYMDLNGTTLYQYDIIYSVMLNKIPIFPTFQSQALFLCYGNNTLYVLESLDKQTKIYDLNEYQKNITIKPLLINTIFTDTPLRGCKIDPFSNNSIISFTNNTFVSINLNTSKIAVIDPTSFVSESEKITSPLAFNPDCSKIYFYIQMNLSINDSNLAIYDVMNKTITYSSWVVIADGDDIDYFAVTFEKENDFYKYSPSEMPLKLSYNPSTILIVISFSILAIGTFYICFYKARINRVNCCCWRVRHTCMKCLSRQNKEEELMVREIVGNPITRLEM